MKINKKGFTLLEMLVVVLIIGILASIALPQYRRAVLRANISKGISLVETLFEAQHLYFLENGEYAADLDDLSIETPHDDSCQKWIEGTVSGWSCPWGQVEVAVDLVSFFYPVQEEFDSRAEIGYGHILDASAMGGRFNDFARYCLARPDNENAQAVCEELGGTLVDENNVWKYYEIQ